MPYFLMSDTIGDDPRWDVLSSGKPALSDALLAAFTRLQSGSSHHMHDGYLTRAQALSKCHGRGKTLELLCTPVLGRPPFLHRPGDTCAEKNCIDASPAWIDGFEYRVCAFSKRNPTKSERDRNAAQKADSLDAALRAMVYDRDGGSCRYCRSGRLKKKGMGRAKDRRRALQFDHVDPDQAAGADGANYVTACARCNELKGHRTPDEADMVLLPVPTATQLAEWATRRGEQLFDQPTDGTDPCADNHNDNPADNPRDNHADNHTGVVDPGCPEPLSNNESAGAVRPEPAAQAQRQHPETTFEGSGSGRVGHRVVTPAAPLHTGPGGQPIRTPEAPDIYHGRSRPSALNPQPPPGGVP